MLNGKLVKELVDSLITKEDLRFVKHMIPGGKFKEKN